MLASSLTFTEWNKWIKLSAVLNDSINSLCNIFLFFFFQAVPQVRVTPRIQSRKPGEESQMKCHAIGEPLPKVSRTFNWNHHFVTHRK